MFTDEVVEHNELDINHIRVQDKIKKYYNEHRDIFNLDYAVLSDLIQNNQISMAKTCVNYIYNSRGVKYVNMFSSYIYNNLNTPNTHTETESIMNIISMFKFFKNKEVKNQAHINFLDLDLDELEMNYQMLLKLIESCSASSEYFKEEDLNKIIKRIETNKLLVLKLYSEYKLNHFADIDAKDKPTYFLKENLYNLLENSYNSRCHSTLEKIFTRIKKEK